MQNDEGLNPIELELERALQGLRPTESDGVAAAHSLAFRLGEASMRRRMRVWQGAAGVAGLCLAMSLALGPVIRQRAEPNAGVPQPLAEAPAMPPSVDPVLPYPGAESQRNTSLAFEGGKGSGALSEKGVLSRGVQGGWSRMDYARIREVVLALGADALPPDTVWYAGTAGSRAAVSGHVNRGGDERMDEVGPVFRSAPAVPNQQTSFDLFMQLMSSGDQS